jgi:intein/homing endonuclease
VKYVGTLQQQASAQGKRVSITPVDYWIDELVDTKHDILTFTMKSGGVLAVTPNHPVLTDDGSMKLAEDFKVGESLVRQGGSIDPIVSIEKSEYFGKVYNLFVKSADLRANVVITNGYLNGTAYFQNEGAQYLNRHIFRNNLTRGAFSK